MCRGKAADVSHDQSQMRCLKKKRKKVKKSPQFNFNLNSTRQKLKWVLSRASMTENQAWELVAEPRRRTTGISTMRQMGTRDKSEHPK